MEEIGPAVVEEIGPAVVEEILTEAGLGWLMLANAG